MEKSSLETTSDTSNQQLPIITWSAEKTTVVDDRQIIKAVKNEP